jgi:hypothetical protein
VQRIALIVVLGGFASAAAIETVKRLVPVRGVFHGALVKRWIGDTAWKDLSALLLVQNLKAASSARKRTRNSDGLRRTGLLSVFDLPLEQLSARIASAFGRATDEPEEYRYLFLRLAAADSRLSRQAIEFSMGRFAPDIDDGFGEWSLEISPAVSGHAQEELDGFQLQTAHQWRRNLAWWSVALSSLFSAVLGLTTDDHLSMLIIAITAPFVGGFTSWVIRDLAASVENWRRR